MRDVPRVDAAADAFETFALLGESRLDAVLVETGNEVVGVLSESDYAHALAIGRESGPAITW